ncbi:MAG TPA: hypothetical protein VK487_04640 [Candidatus Bathyarchaeia archaeon]|nr:hypothetical protein [Candidatus Bathyarchaeia archaeon]
MSEKNFSSDQSGDDVVLGKKLALSSVRSRKVTRIPSQTTYKITVYLRAFRIVPAEKRIEYIEMLDGVIKRLLTMINSKKTKTPVRLKCMMVFNYLINTSYNMITDVEVEELERQTAELEEEAKRSATEDSDDEEENNPT